MTEPRFAKSKVRPGRITCDPASQTLLVHYEIEATVIGDYGEKLSTDCKEKVKRYKLKIKPSTDIRRMAEDVVQKSKLIHHSKLEHVENLIFEMQQYISDTDHGAVSLDREKKQEKSPARAKGDGPELFFLVFCCCILCFNSS